MRDAPKNAGDGNPWRSGSEESFGPEKKQTAQGEPIGQGVRLGEGRPEQKLVERVKSEHPDHPPSGWMAPPSIPRTSGTTEKVDEKTTVVSTLPTRWA